MRAAEFSEWPNQFGVGNRDDVLRIEDARAQERHGNRRLEPGLTRTRRVRNEAYQSAIRVFGWDTDHQRRPNLGLAAMPRSTNQTSPRRGVIQIVRGDRVRGRGDRRPPGDPRPVERRAVRAPLDERVLPRVLTDPVPAALRIRQGASSWPASRNQSPMLCMVRQACCWFPRPN